MTERQQPPPDVDAAKERFRRGEMSLDAYLESLVDAHTAAREDGNGADTPQSAGAAPEFPPLRPATGGPRLARERRPEESRKIIGTRFELEECIASDDTATVWRAKDLLASRYAPDRSLVSVTILDRRLAVDEKRLAEVLRGALAVRSLRHANIAEVRELHQFGDDYLIVSEWLEGETLAWRLDRPQPLAHDEVRRILAGIAAALDYARAKGLGHGDVRPNNVFITADGQVKLLDFGFRVTGQEAMVPDPARAPPRAGLRQPVPPRARPRRRWGRPAGFVAVLAVTAGIAWFLARDDAAGPGDAPAARAARQATVRESPVAAPTASDDAIEPEVQASAPAATDALPVEPPADVPPPAADSPAAASADLAVESPPAAAVPEPEPAASPPATTGAERGQADATAAPPEPAARPSGPPVVGFASAEQVIAPESAGYLRLQVRARGTLRGPVQLSVSADNGAARLNEDFVIPVRQITLDSRRRTEEVLVALVEDGTRENVEDFRVLLSVASGDASLHTSAVNVVITDDD